MTERPARPARAQPARRAGRACGSRARSPSSAPSGLYDRLLAGRGRPRAAATSVAGRLAGLDPERDLERRPRARHPLGRPRRRRVAGRRSTTSTRSSRCSSSGGAPLGLWVRGPLRLDALGRLRSPSWAPAPPPPTAPTWPPRSPPGWPARAARSSPGPPFGIDQAAHRGALAGAARPWPSSPAASTGPTRRPTRHSSTTSPRARRGRVRAGAGLRADARCGSCRATG